MDEQSVSLFNLIQKNNIKLDIEFGLNDLWSNKVLVDEVADIVAPKLERESCLLSSGDYIKHEGDFAIIIPVMTTREIGAIPLGISLALRFGAILALWKEVADYKWVESDITYSKLLSNKSIVLLEDVCRNNYILDRLSETLEVRQTGLAIKERWIIIDSRETSNKENQSYGSVDNVKPQEIIFLKKTDLWKI